MENWTAGYLLKNEEPKSVVLASCRDGGSAGVIARGFVSTGATRQPTQLPSLRNPAAGPTCSNSYDQPGFRRYGLPEDGRWGD